MATLVSAAEVAALFGYTEEDLLAMLHKGARQPTQLPIRRLYKRKEAAQLLGMSVRSLDFFVAQKRIMPRRVGRKVMFTAEQITKFIRRDHSDTRQK